MNTVFVPLLAFSFASPLLLGGLALAAIPIVIHFLFKRRYRETSWAAMRFLLEAARKHSRRIRLEQLLLLMVRTLILLLLALALARPYVEALGTYFEADVPTHRIIVLDASYSMGTRSKDLSRFDRAKQVARRVVTSAGQGDALNLVRLAGGPPRAVVSQPAYQKHRVLEEIEGLELSHEFGDAPGTLQEVEALLQDAEKIGRKQVCIISDLQQASWLPDSEEGAAQLRRSLERLADNAELIFVDVGRANAANAAVTGFTSEESLAAVDKPVRLQATVANFGAESLDGRSLELRVDGRTADTRQVTVEPGSKKQIDFSHTFDTGGAHRLEVRLDDGGIALDNRRRLALAVREELHVLLVNGRPSGEPMGDATAFVDLALSPTVEGRPWRGIIRPHTISSGELAGTELADYDCVFLCNVGLLTEREAELLHAYVKSGGGLIVSLGDQVDAENYNRVLGRGGDGLLPGELQEQVGSTDSNAEAYTFETEYGHPIVNPFRGNPDAGLETSRTSVYHKTVLREESRSRAVIRYSSGDPALLEKPFGQGRCLLLTTSVDREWGSWVVWPSFPPLINELVRYAVSGRSQKRTLLVGEPLTETFLLRALDMSVTVAAPDETEKTIRPVRNGELASITYAETGRAGFYELALGPPLDRSLTFAVNVDTAESDLQKLSRSELKAELLPETRFLYRTKWEGAGYETEAPATTRGGLSRWLLVAALCLLLVEQVMAWSFFYGFLLLYGIVGLAAVRQMLFWNATAALVLSLMFVLGLAGILYYRFGPRGRGRSMAR